MNIRPFFCMAAALIAAVPQGTEAKNERDKDPRPNILFILADDMGKECLGCYGSTYNTPNLDRFAEEGVQFNSATSQPLSTPSRVELLTGRYNYKNYSKFGFMNQDEHTFAQLAQEAGYATGIAGKWQLGTNDKLPAHFGFDNYCLYHLMYKGNKYAKPFFEVDGVIHKDCTENDYGPDFFSDYICNFMEKNKEKPFLAYYCMTLVHDPFQATPESDDWNVDPQKRFDVDDKYFPDMVSYTDKLFGKVMDKLRLLKLEDNTIVIFIGDNGTATYISTKMKDGTRVQGGKARTIETGTAVPMIARWGKYSYMKHTTDDLIDFTDFLPTFAEAMKKNVPKTWDIDGRSFLPVLQGKDNANKRDYVFVHYKPNHIPQARLEQFSARYYKDHQYKLYSNGLFYDFVNDPNECHPIAEGKGTPEAEATRTKFAKLMAKLPHWDYNTPNVKMVIEPGLEPKSTGVGQKWKAKKAANANDNASNLKKQNQ